MDDVYKMIKVLNAKKPSNYEIARTLHLSNGHLCDIKKGRIDPFNVKYKTIKAIAAYYNKGM